MDPRAAGRVAESRQARTTSTGWSSTSSTSSTRRVYSKRFRARDDAHRFGVAWGDATFAPLVSPLVLGFEVLELPARFRIERGHRWVVENVRQKMQWSRHAVDPFYTSDPIQHELAGRAETYQLLVAFNRENREDPGGETSIDVYLKPSRLGVTYPPLVLVVNGERRAGFRAHTFALLEGFAGCVGVRVPGLQTLAGDELHLHFEEAAAGEQLPPPATFSLV